VTSGEESKVGHVHLKPVDEGHEPPRSLWGTLRHLGPGIILVGAIVGSGELIMTTKLGAEAGFVLLWFVLVSCIVKVIVQAELARFTISSGKTFLEVFNALPGPSTGRPAWLTLGFMATAVGTTFLGLSLYTFLTHRQLRPTAAADGLGAWTGPLIVAAVLAIVISAGLLLSRRGGAEQQPTRGAKAPRDEQPQVGWFMWYWLASYLLIFINGGAVVGGAGQALQLAMPDLFGAGGAKYWAIFVAVLCGGLLLSGGYLVVERLSLGLVGGFTFITVVCTALLQATGYSVSFADIRQGLTCGFPTPLAPILVLLALSTYAITGVTGNEMISYTYWCLEKGYARNTGTGVRDENWARRAQGWIRVMYVDVLLSMVVYTGTTVCFFILGAAILHAKGLSPDGVQTLSVLSHIYTETLGGWAAMLFVVGSFFVLFSTTVSNVAAHARILTDVLGVIQLIDGDDYQRRRQYIRRFVVLLLCLFVVAYFAFENPPLMLIISGLSTVILYPILGLGTLYLRYRRVDPRIAPGRSVTLLLWLSGVAVAIISPATLLLALLIQQGWISF
jgi:Mn2+/Fe2+ NRAMP family transporter